MFEDYTEGFRRCVWLTAIGDRYLATLTQHETEKTFKRKSLLIVTIRMPTRDVLVQRLRGWAHVDGSLEQVSHHQFVT